MDWLKEMLTGHCVFHNQFVWVFFAYSVGPVLRESWTSSKNPTGCNQNIRHVVTHTPAAWFFRRNSKKNTHICITLITDDVETVSVWSRLLNQWSTFFHNISWKETVKNLRFPAYNLIVRVFETCGQIHPMCACRMGKNTSTKQWIILWMVARSCTSLEFFKPIVG